MKKLVYTSLCFLLVNFLSAQSCRYLEEIFPSVKITPDIVYGRNASVLEFPIYGQAIPKDLILDLYEPEGDTASKRALIIYFHSGNFLPWPNSGQVNGTHRDSTSVEICKKLARCGYVVASADYRIGWNPIDTSEIIRRTGIINAAYRGLQDARTCIRFFRKGVVDGGDPFKIDDERIALFGDDTGGYLSTHASALDRFDEILAEPQLYIPTPLGLKPMINEYMNGDVEGKKYGVNTPQNPIFPFPAGDTLCYANYPEYSSHFRASVNLGGAVVNTAWIEWGEPPIISIHSPYDFTTPYTSGKVTIKYIGPVIYVYGSYSIAERCTHLGNNGWFKIDPSSYCNELQVNVHQVAESRNDGWLGLFPVIGDTITDVSPWEFWNPITNPGQPPGTDDNPHMSKMKAVIYMDSILAYSLPRLFEVMDLEKLSTCIIAKTKDQLLTDVDLKISPNPANNEIEISSPEYQEMLGINIYDLQGKLVKRESHIQQTIYRVKVNDLSSGMYILQIQFDQGIVVRQLIIQ